VLYVEDGCLVRAEGAGLIDRLHLQREMSPVAAALPPDVLLASVAGAWALGLDAQTIRTGLETYGTVEPQTLVIA
jgi:hypothetical protein